jgi:P pilus assembly chaperone PapD
MYRSLLAIIFLLPIAAFAQGGSSMALAPARFELEMEPGTEKTVVVSLDFKSADLTQKPVRVVASLNDWTITRDGRVEYFPANTQPNSASPWLIYSPGEAAVAPGTIHQIRVTVAVPRNATAGDHLAALIVEQRPDTIKTQTNARQMVLRYRIASVFYIKVAGYTKKGIFEDLTAEATSSEVIVTPVLRNEGNSVLRPNASVTVFDEKGTSVASIADHEQFPILGGAEIARPTRIEKTLAAGKYTVKYRVDFQDGLPPKEGVTDLVVAAAPQIASSGTPPKKP